MNKCPFCKIISGELPGRVVFQDDEITAFHDIHPVAPIHILIVPNKHIESINNISSRDEGLVGRLFTVARELAVKESITNSGYRLIINTGRDANQTIFHLHLHLIGGQPVRYPMG